MYWKIEGWRAGESLGNFEGLLKKFIFFSGETQNCTLRCDLLLNELIHHPAQFFPAQIWLRVVGWHSFLSLKRARNETAR